ncbi:hypothetical protein BdWA1_002751 [Babesia duncani]|uniref:Uncharacterized protein n=1 Tax=Babesia duncani TaxID=323732 RepID=A0AAD9UNR0_9APIC|nr:hypothetical protein BdWA1_002751 [Babesia duncani]
MKFSVKKLKFLIICCQWFWDSKCCYSIKIHSGIASRAISFTKLDLIQVLEHLRFYPLQIFGRLSDTSKIGHVIANSNQYLSGNKELKNLKWRRLFTNENEKINLEQFSNALVKIKFNWPQSYMTNSKPVFLVSEDLQSKYRHKNYLGLGLLTLVLPFSSRVSSV